MTLKQNVHETFMKVLEGKISALEAGLAELFESGKNETKSTAGDKHETALAMLQLEQENLRRQLRSLLEQKVILTQLDPSVVSNDIRPGSLITTDKGTLYMSTSLGKITMGDKTIISVSPHSPLGQRLRTLTTGDTAHFNNIVYAITRLQ